MRLQRAHHSLGGARVLARELRGEPCPTFRRRAPRHGCQPCFRGSRLPSRVPSALSPSGPASAAHTLDQDSPANGNVSRAGDDCGVVVVKQSCGTTTALLRRPGKEGPAPVPRANQSSGVLSSACWGDVFVVQKSGESIQEGDLVDVLPYAL